MTLFFIFSFFLFVSFGVTAQPAPTQQAIVTTNQPAEVKISESRLGERDPFLPPKYIRDMLMVKPEDIIDGRMEAIRRWPLSEYKLKGIIWDVRNPKAMIIDKTNTLHLLKKNYRIGNREGLISQINESEIIVIQKGVPIVVPIETLVNKPPASASSAATTPAQVSAPVSAPSAATTRMTISAPPAFVVPPINGGVKK